MDPYDELAEALRRRLIERAREGGAGGDGLEAEVRALVESRNRRRTARGEPPLDVDAEVARHLRHG